MFGKFFNKETHKAMNINTQDIIATAQAIKQQSHALNAFENASQYDRRSVNRIVSIWRDHNAQALAYNGPDVKTLETEVTEAYKAINTAKTALHKVELELNQRYGSIAVAGMEIDAALVAKREEAAREVMRKQSAHATVSAELLNARKHETAVSDAAFILSALLGVK